MPYITQRVVTEAFRAIAEKSDEKTGGYFAASILGLMAMISISHGVGNLLHGRWSGSNAPALRAAR